MSTFDFVCETVKRSRSKNPFELAMLMMSCPSLSNDQCEYALIFTGAVLAAVKNAGTIKLSNNEIIAALETIKGKTDFIAEDGAANKCDMTAGVRFVFSTIFKAARGEKTPDDVTMKVVARALEHLSDNMTNLKCFKNTVLTTLDLVTSLLLARFEIKFDGSAQDIICYQVGAAADCNPAVCQYSPLLNAR